MEQLLKEAGQLLISINNQLAKKQKFRNLTEEELDNKEKIKNVITKIRETGIVDDADLLT